MAQTPGTKFGPYEILAQLGAGGMGEVYRARDARLGRDVAIKVLSEHLSARPDLKARFEREARAVAALNHPHICVLHDVGSESGTDYLVMELVEGESLAQRLERGALAPAEVLRVGREIADALDRAHKAGIIHRDLKPGNVMLTRSGVKLMDFGLARGAGLGGTGTGSAATRIGMTQSPTVAQPLTMEGAIVGTFQYMSPEQLEGNEADARSDLWALGCVLYEMATGHRAFEGKSQASLIGSIMNARPTASTDETPISPPALGKLIGALLSRDPADRIQTAHDVKLQLSWMEQGSSMVGAPAVAAAPRRPFLKSLPWYLAGLGAMLSVVLGAIVFFPPKLSDPIVFSVLPASGSRLTGAWSDIAISPDGRKIAYIAADSSGNSLYIRPMGSPQARALPETRDATSGGLFWSPDSRTVVYFAIDGKMKKVSVVDGLPVSLVEARGGRGGTWNKNGEIVFAPRAEGPLYRTSPSGGDAQPVTELNPGLHETGHRYPCFLPDGDHFVYAALPGGADGLTIYVGSLKSKTSKKLMTAGSAAVFAPPHYLVFTRENRVLSQWLDLKTLELKGEPAALDDAPSHSTVDGEPVASASSNGRLAILQSRATDARLQWLDRSGQPRGVISLPTAPWSVLRLSPDGQRVGVANGSNLWVVDLARGFPTRIAATSTGSNTPALMCWAPDGNRIAYLGTQAGRDEIFVATADGSPGAKLLPTTNGQFKDCYDWSADGQNLVIGTLGTATAWDISLLPMDGFSRPEPYLADPTNELLARISPDGKWLAYASNESGLREIYAQSFPLPGHKIRMTVGGVGRFMWARGGSEIVFSRGDSLYSLPVETGEDLKPGSPRPLFKLPQGQTGIDATADGERILVSAPLEIPQREIKVMVDWIGLLKR